MTMNLMTTVALVRIATGIATGSAMVLATVPAQAKEVPADIAPGGSSEIVVFGRGEAKIGTAHAASEGSVGGSDLLVRPLLRVAELLEAVPGMVAAQHSGSGKANQYFLRGFNLDHGTDFTTYIDGVQMNLRSHGHGQGYLDLNGLIPEVVAREDHYRWVRPPVDLGRRGILHVGAPGRRWNRQGCGGWQPDAGGAGEAL
jgi:outer membrane receptor protein involved in Fe transport